MKQPGCKVIFSLSLILIILTLSCSHKKNIRFLNKPVVPGSKVAIIVDGKNSAKNAVLSRFMAKGYEVMAVNASDFYSLKDVFDIKDMKKISYKSKPKDSVISIERTINNIYKLHIYNFEVSKAEILNELKTKWRVQYIILLDLKDWQDISWGRAINLSTYQIVWIENYPTSDVDNIETVTDHFIQSMSKR
jgi:hypothetical protein